MTHPDYWNSVPYSAELDSAAKVPTAASTGKQGFGAATDGETMKWMMVLLPGGLLLMPLGGWREATTLNRTILYHFRSSI